MPPFDEFFESLRAEVVQVVRSELRMVRDESPRTVVSAPLRAPPKPPSGLEVNYTTEEVAEYLIMKESTVAAYCRSGRLKANKVARRWLVGHSALMALKAEVQEGGHSAPPPGVDDAASRVLSRVRMKGVADV